MNLKDRITSLEKRTVALEAAKTKQDKQVNSYLKDLKLRHEKILEAKKKGESVADLI